MDVSNAKLEVAIPNVKKLLNATESILNQFESSQNFHVVSYRNEWINHPDEFFVELGVFKRLLRGYFGDIKMKNFLTDYQFDTTVCDKVKDFTDWSKLLYSKISYNEVECAYNQLLKLDALLCS